MQSRSINLYIGFGAAIRYLQDAREGFPAHGASHILGNIEILLKRLDDFDLHVTRRAASDLENFLTSVKETAPEHTLTSAEAQQLSKTITDLRKTLRAEATGKLAFIVTDKRITVDKLLGRVRALFAPKVFDKLEDVAKYDFDEAGKCIAFERSTAAAFHLVRGTESVLRSFYCSVVLRKKDRVDFLWGPMVEHLRKRKRPPPVTLLDNLDNIRRNFRNPTQHPEKIYDIQEAQDLFGICVDAVNRMVAAGVK